MEVFFLKGVERIIIVLGAIVFAYFGYRLYALGVEKGRSHLAAESGFYKFILSGTGPGLFFMSVGGIILTTALLSGSNSLRKQTSPDLTSSTSKVEENFTNETVTFPVLQEEESLVQEDPKFGNDENARGSPNDYWLNRTRAEQFTAQIGLEDVHFDFNSNQLNERAKSILTANAEWLKAHPDAVVTIEGHCDERETLAYYILGKERATNTKNYLTHLGVSENRLEIMSYGKDLPACSDATESCYQQNRRTHLFWGIKVSTEEEVSESALPSGSVSQIDSSQSPRVQTNSSIQKKPKDEQVVVYQKAFSLLREKNYDRAAEEFSGFILNFPDSSLASNSQYWLGECYYGQRRFQEAIEEFERVFTFYPSSNKVPASLLKIGYSHLELQQPSMARSVFQQLVRTYPQSPEAIKARNRLKKVNALLSKTVLKVSYLMTTYL